MGGQASKQDSVWRGREGRRRRWRWRPGGLKGEKGKCVALLDNTPSSTEVRKKSVDVGTATCCNVQQNNNLPAHVFCSLCFAPPDSLDGRCSASATIKGKDSPSLAYGLFKQ